MYYYYLLANSKIKKIKITGLKLKEVSIFLFIGEQLMRLGYLIALVGRDSVLKVVFTQLG